MRELLQAWEAARRRSLVARRASYGLQAYTQGRRDLLAPGGVGNVRPYAEATLTMGLGAFTFTLRPAWEDRLHDDPDFHPGSDPVISAIKQVYRFVEAYATAVSGSGRPAFTWARCPATGVPLGLLGIPISDYGYPRTDALVLVREPHLPVRSARCAAQRRRH